MQSNYGPVITLFNKFFHLHRNPKTQGALHCIVPRVCEVTKPHIIYVKLFNMNCISKIDISWINIVFDLLHSKYIYIAFTNDCNSEYRNALFSLIWIAIMSPEAHTQRNWWNVLLLLSCWVFLLRNCHVASIIGIIEQLQSFILIVKPLCVAELPIARISKLFSKTLSMISANCTGATQFSKYAMVQVPYREIDRMNY